MSDKPAFSAPTPAPGWAPGTAPVPAPARGGAARTVGAVLAVVVLAVLALAVAGIGLLLTLSMDSCGTAGTEDVFVCGTAGMLVTIGSPIAGAVLGVLVALGGFLPLPFRHRRPILISAGYLIVLAGLGIGFLGAFGLS
ncbi:hypothetical protein ACTOB_006905 [Actinoplanes oblitus]|uniref:Uncharacterized protein n=1 Tax=Actinoplanes oblitus TaxID=3040509 RepID=A0ABY8WCS5_9ACTN|nr:hypothetical protein [Actinoplanes oblitus]WIM94848.1 hypothetical protein ACTOB_006905 [Actinoplanes oblitus]